MRLSTILLLLLLFPTLTNAQRPNGQGGKKGPGNGLKTKVTGKVLDQQHKSPLEFATVTLYSLRDSSIVTGIITDNQGLFTLESRPGRFYAQVEFIGYQKKTINDITLNRENPTVDLGEIFLGTDAEMLDEVEVIGEKSQFQMSLDKKIFNVGKDLTSKGANAMEVLDNVPSVTVDVEGNIELRGSGNVRILVNGKPSGLVGIGNTDGLRAMAGSTIERIEVITNPSARYDAEGIAGIINIVLKEDRQSGLNGSFDLSAGYPELYGAAINLNYRKDKFNFFTTYGLRYDNAPGGGSVYQESINNGVTLISEQKRDQMRGGLSNSIRLGADYFFNEKNILTTAFNFRKSNDDNTNNIIYRDFLESLNNPTGINDRNEKEDEDENKLEYELNYRRNFARKGQELTINLDYQDNTETENSDFIERLLNPDGSPKGDPDIQQQSRNQEGESRLILSTDYIHPFGKDGKFELGMRSSIREITNDYLVEQLNDDGEFEIFRGLSNNFIYDENIHAAYAIYGNKIKKFSYQVGVRAEYSDVKTELIQSDSVNDRNYLNLFPSAFLGYQLSEKDAIQLSYSRRVRRPRFWDLNPFFTFSDSRNFFSGNPNLDPEYTDAFELGYMRYMGKGSFGSSVYYRYTTDVIERILTADALGNTIRRPENLSTEQNFGLEVNSSYSPTSDIRLNANFNFFRSITEGEALGKSFDADTYGWTARISSKVTFFKKLDGQLSYNFRGPRQTTQGSRQAVHSMNLAFGMDILKNNGTLTFSVRDVFNSRKRRSTIDNPDFYQKSEFQWRARQFTLSLNYRLNQKKKRGGDRGGDYEGGEGGDF